MAAYDLPATVDKILSVTGAQQVFYVGHSQGCEIAIAELSRDPDFASKIKLFVGLAPATYLGDIKSPLIKLLPYAKELEVKFVNVIRNTLVSHVSHSYKMRSVSTLRNTFVAEQKLLHELEKVNHEGRGVLNRQSEEPYSLIFQPFDISTI